MALIESGNDTPGIANVDAEFNLTVRTPQTESKAGFAQLSSEVDKGTVTGSRLVRALEASEGWRLRVGTDAPIFADIFAGAAINSSLWAAPVTTMTVTVAAGFLTLNAGSSVASAAVARVSSYRSIPVFISYGSFIDIIAQFAFAPVANNVTEWGFGIATGTSAPTDGAFFRLNAAGEFRAVVNNNGTEIQSETLDFDALVGALNTRHFIVECGEDSTTFWIDDVIVAKINRGAAGANPTASSNLPVLFRTYNSAITSSAQQIKIAGISCSFVDGLTSKPFSHIAAGSGNFAQQGQTGGTMGSTALYGNSTNPGAAVPTNTSAALGSGLGGNFWQTNTLAVNTDGIICSYQAPLGTAALPGKSLYITGVRVDSAVQTALANAGAGVYCFSLAWGHTAVSLATTESATTKAPRRMALGIQTFTGAAAEGAQATPIDLTLSTPICVQPGEFIQVVQKNIGTVGTAGVIAHLIAFQGYWE